MDHEQGKKSCYGVYGDRFKKKRRTLTSKVIIFCSQGGAKRKIVNFQNYYFG